MARSEPSTSPLREALRAAGRCLRRLKVIGICCALLGVLSLFVCDLREWYVYVDPFAAAAWIRPALLASAFLPFLVALDPTGRARVGNRFWLTSTALAMLAFQLLWWLLIVVGTFFRGPFYEFRWPWEERVPELVLLSSINLSEFYWIRGIDGPLPANPLVREVPGLALLAMHLVAVPVFATLLLERRSPQMAWWRILAFFAIVQVAALLPIKMALRWAIDLKYIVAFPEQFLNL